MVKAYLRYEPAASFGVIASLESNISFDSSGKHLLAPALEKVGVWHVRQCICTKELTPSSSSRGPSVTVTSISSSPSSLIASGYANGSITIWNHEAGTCETTLNGHKGAVTALRYNKSGFLLASGSKDNDVILWDVIGETGLFRLRGHRDQVTDVIFVSSDKKLVSSSKDKFLRVWDLDTQHCMQIISGHHSEIWSMDIDPNERYLVTGSADKELRFYVLKGSENDHSMNGDNTVGNGDSSVQNKWEVFRYFGEIQRQNKDRVATVQFNKSGNLLACQVAGKTVEIYRVLDYSEANRKAKRRLHRKEKKHGKKSLQVIETEDRQNQNAAGDDPVTTDQANETINLTVTIPDVFKLLHTVRASKKICSISFSPITPKNSLATLALSLNNNLMELYSINNGTATKSVAIELQGHRSDVRSLTLSSDNTLLMSTSHNAVKIWNPSTGSCLRTIDSGYGLCGIILPHSNYGLIGTKSGSLEIIDIGSATCLEVVEAHGGSVSSIALLPDENGFVTGSADHDVKFWEYQLKQKPGQVRKQLSVTNVRTLKMDDDVLVVAISPDAKYIAFALLDDTVKIHFVDTFKVFLKLYGHKLSVLCMDFSSDGALIVTGSADKNIKIWGLDFGDCHKSIFAHADSVTAVKFVPRTHYVFTAGKDRLVKYWDADKFELLLVLEGHHADIWCLAVSSRGDFVVTGSHDRSIRRWDRTEEQFFLDEEKDRRMDEMLEADIDNAFHNKYVPKEEVPEEGAVAVAGKKTQETLSATDLIIERLDIADTEIKRIAEHQAQKNSGEVTVFQANPIMNGLSPSDYVLSAFSNVHSNDLEQTLMALTFPDALKILSYLKDWTSYPDKVELVCRISTLLVQIHYNQLVTTPAAKHVLSGLNDFLYKKVKAIKDMVGFNLAAMDHLQQMLASRSDIVFHDAKSKLQEIRARQSKREQPDLGPVRPKKKKTQK